MENIKQRSDMELLNEELNRLMALDSKFSSKPFVRAMINLKTTGKKSEYISLEKFKKILWLCTSEYVSRIERNKSRIDYVFSGYSSKDMIVDFTSDNKQLEISYKEKKIMQINCEGLPKLIDGNESNYDKIKTYIFDLIPLQNNYMIFLDNFEREISLGQMTTITISNKYGIEYPTIILKIGELALLEIHSKKDEYGSNGYYIIVYSQNPKINNILQCQKEKLLSQICIPKSVIPQLLQEYEKL